MTPTQTITAAIYQPVSTDHARTAQHEYATRKGWMVVEFREQPTRATKRPVFNQMMYAAWRHRFDIVLVPTLDCFADSLAELSRILTTLDRLGIRLITLDKSTMTDRETPAGRKFLKVLGVLTTVESSMRARNVRAGVAAAKRKGIHCGRPRLPFPRERARRLESKGLSVRAIAERLDLPARTVADALKRGRPPVTRKPQPLTAPVEERLL